MPFDTGTARNIGQSTITVLSANSIQTITIIGCTIANKLTEPCTANVVYDDGTNETYMGVNIYIPVGSTYVPIGGDLKLVLSPLDSLKVTANLAAALDVTSSYLWQV